MGGKHKKIKGMNVTYPLNRENRNLCHISGQEKSDDDYEKLADLIVEVTTQLLYGDLIDKWLEIN